jgi:hypothetical protein
MNGREYEAIEQNPEKPSRWGQLARDGHQVVQFKDNETSQYSAPACVVPQFEFNGVAFRLATAVDFTFGVDLQMWRRNHLGS